MRRFTLLVFLSYCPLAAQDGRGVILGRITDSTGAVVPGAKIDVLHKATGVKVASTSNEQGHYEAPFLLPGIYDVSIEATGFKKAVRPGIELRVSDRLRTDIVLELGQLSESVTITSEVPLVEATTATMGQVTDRRRIIDLPLSGGNPMTLLRLAPGVSNLGAPNHPSLLGAVGAINNFTVDGVAAGNTEYAIDGAPAMSGTGPAFQPPAEMVEEFKISTATYDASSGRTPGATISVVLKSGANRPHGSLYSFHNNNTLQGMDMFQRQRLYDLSTGPVTPEKRKSVAPQHVINRYGGSASGPLWIPGIYNGKNRTFWAYGFEGFIRPSVERGNWYFTVPTVRQRQGDFSELLPLGTVFQVYDPRTIASAPGGRFSRQPFAGNVVPASRIDPLARKFLDIWPQPNVAGGNDGRLNYFRPTPSRNQLISNTGRFDHVISERQRLSGRFNYTKGRFQAGQTMPTEYLGTVEQRSNRLIGVDDVITLSPTLIVSIRANFARYHTPTEPQASAVDLAGLGFAPGFVNTIDPAGRFFPALAPAGYTSVGGVAPRYNYTNYGALGGDVTKIRGSHSLRMGSEVRVYREHNYTFDGMSSTLDFGTTWTRGPLDNSPAAPIGQGLASYLLGLPTSGAMTVNASYATQSWYGAIFLQDDWKLTRRLTLNVGLRYEYDSPLTERFNRSVRDFDFGAVNPIDAVARANYAANPVPEVPVAQFRAMGGLTFAGVNGRPRNLWNAQRRNFAPRIGIAYQLNTRTAVRAGYGVYFFARGADRSTPIQNGYGRVTDLVSSTDNGLTFLASLANPFPNGPLPPRGPSLGLSQDVGNGVSIYNGNLPTAYTQRWSFGVQRELSRTWMVEASYVGNRAVRMQMNRNYNAISQSYLSRSPERDQATIDFLSTQVNNPFFPQLPGTNLAAARIARSQLLRPYPAFIGINKPESQGYSWFHSLQLRTERRLSRGFTAQAGYTWSKWMNAISLLNEADPLPEKVIAATDRPQRVTLSGIWEVPFGRNRQFAANAPALVDGLIGGWQFQATWEAQSGPPIGFDNVLFRGNLADLVLPVSNRSPDRWFNIDAGFERNAARALANNVRAFPSRLTGLRAAGLNVWNWSAVKAFRISEGTKLQFRCEWLNATNHTHLVAPNTAPANSQFGRVTASNGFPRQIYFALKLMF